MRTVRFGLGQRLRLVVLLQLLGIQGRSCWRGDSAAQILLTAAAGGRWQGVAGSGSWRLTGCWTVRGAINRTSPEDATQVTKRMETTTLLLLLLLLLIWMLCLNMYHKDRNSARCFIQLNNSRELFTLLIVAYCKQACFFFS